MVNGYLFNLGDIHAELDNLRESKKAFSELVKLHPEVADFSVALSKAMQAMGEEETISTLKESIKRYPEQFAADIALSQLW